MKDQTTAPEYPTAVSLGWSRGVRQCEMCGYGVRLTNAVVIGHDQGVALFAHKNKKRCR